MPVIHQDLFSNLSPLVLLLNITSYQKIQDGFAKGLALSADENIGVTDAGDMASSPLHKQLPNHVMFCFMKLAKILI